MDESSTPAHVTSTQENDSNDSSLTLSLTPPVCDEPDGHKEETSTISEHLSVENDRSMQEIEVDFPDSFLLDLPVERLSQEPKPISLNSSVNNSSSIISLNGLDKFIAHNMECRNNVSSILEEILSNDQFKSHEDEDESSIDLFANVNLDDKILNSYNLGKCDFNLNNDSINNGYDEVGKRVRDFEEVIAVKDAAIAQLTTELDSYREMLSYPSSNSLGTSTTDYKQYQDETHNKFVEYHNAMVRKDEQIEKLTQSLQQSVLNREEMKQHFKNELAQLQEELRKTSDLLKIQRQDILSSPRKTADSTFSRIIEILGPENAELVEIFRKNIQRENEEKNRALIEEIGTLKTKIEADRIEFEEEMNRLKSLLSKDVSSEINAKHSKEMEELRTYFEKKCADLEKNYSEEIFSRKISGSSSCSEAELSADFPFNQPGPGGDTLKQEYTKKDLIRLKENLTQIMETLNRYNFDEISSEDIETLISEISKADLRNVLKFDVNLLKNEMKNQYQAELEMVQEDFDNRIDLMNLEYEKKMQSFQNEIEELTKQLQGRICTTTSEQEVVNSGDFEIDEVVQSYERRLQEQVALAKIDIIAALEAQIQRLVTMENIDDDWPTELLQLKSRFTEKYESDMTKMQEQHQCQLTEMKEEHLKILNSALDRARRRSLTHPDSISKSELELVKERDSFKKQTLALRNLLGELLKYFTQCEDELNNTLVEELISKQLNNAEELSSAQRVHLTPNFTELIDLIDNDNSELDSIDLKSELDECLEKLKSDANAILALTNNLNRQTGRVSITGNGKNLEQEVSLLTRKLINETQQKNDLLERLKETENVVQSLEIDRNTLENQLDQVLEKQKIVEKDLAKAKEKISELIESGHKEIVSEGYGEEGHETMRGMDEARKMLEVLQDRTRAILEKPASLDQNLLNLIEDLARTGEKIIEVAKRDHDDLLQQIEAADKKYKITCQFLEEQAAEREQERDEAQKEIDKLKNRLKDREKDRASCERISNEIENLELQLRDLTKQLELSEKRCIEVENERQEAVDKIYELRDIIRDLEDQIKTRTRSEDELKNIIEELEVYVRQQVKTPETAADSNRTLSDVQEYIAHLENEVQQLRLSTEIAGSEGALQQIKNHLREFETTLDKRTKDMETMYSTQSATTCSSPSEDMSIRDVINRPPPSPTTSAALDECEVPLQQLSRLKEKLIRHSRAEDAAMKRIRDLEMETVALKSELEECQSERDMFRKQMSDHLVLISNLQVRLDEQRIRAEHIEKQTNTSLEVQNYDLKNAIINLEEKLHNKDKVIAQLKNDILETKNMLDEREKDLAAASNQEVQLITEMQEELERLRGENLRLKSKMDQSEEKWSAELSSLRNRASSRNEDYSLINSNTGVPFHRAMNDTVFLGVEPEISSIEKVEPSNMFHSLQQTVEKQNSSVKHVRFEDEVENQKLAQMSVIEELRQKNVDLEEKLERFQDLEKTLENLQKILDETEEKLQKASVTFEEELKKCAETEKKLREDLDRKKIECDEYTSKITEIELKLNESEEKRKVLLDELKTSEENQKELKNLLNNKNKEVEQLQTEKSEQLRKQQQQQTDLNKELNHLQHLITEKDKIITQMSEDSRSLHLNLETIQSKLTETGNIVDLRKRLLDEQKKNAEIMHELHTLKAQNFDKNHVDDLEAQIQRELDYAAKLDSTIINAIDNSIEVHDLESLKLALRKQKSVNRHLAKAKECVEKKFEELEQKVESLVKRNELLKAEVAKGQATLSATQLEDAKLIEQLRIKLDSVLNNELELGRLLKDEKAQRYRAENKLKLTDVKKDKSNDEVRELKSQINQLNNKFEWAKAELATAQLLNSDLEKDILLMKTDLDLKLDEIKKLQSRIKLMEINEGCLNDQLRTARLDIEQKTRYIREVVADREALKWQINKLKTGNVRDFDKQLVPERLMEKIQELRGAVVDNNQMINLIKRLTIEKKTLEERIVELENRDPNNPVPFDDVALRADYLFAKYLRSESYRKALIWQKRYLVENAGIPLLDTPIEERSTGVNRFKRVALCLVALHRMKFLVKRWHSGKRIARQRSVTRTNNQTEAQFRVGRPVSRDVFTKIEPSRSNITEETFPSSGSSPPTKDPSIRVNTTRTISQPPLISPAMLNTYFQRFNAIHNKLGLPK